MTEVVYPNPRRASASRRPRPILGTRILASGSRTRLDRHADGQSSRDEAPGDGWRAEAEHRADRQPGGSAGTARAGGRRDVSLARERARAAGRRHGRGRRRRPRLRRRRHHRRPEPDGRRHCWASIPVAARGTSLREVRAVGRDLGERVRRRHRARRVDRRAPRVLRRAGRGRGGRSAGRRPRTSVVAAHLGRAAVLPGRRARGRRPHARRHHRPQGDARRAARGVSELNDLVETLPDTYVYVDADDIVRRVDRRPRRGSGRPRRADRRGRRRAGLVDACPRTRRRRLRKAVALARATGKPVTAEIATVTPTAIRYDEVRHVPRDGGTLLLHRARHHREQARGGSAAPERGEVPDAVPAHAGHAALDRRRGPPAQRERPLAAAARLHRRRGARSRPSTEFMTDESRRFAREEGFPAFFATGSLRRRAHPDRRQGRLAGRRRCCRRPPSATARQPHPLSVGPGRRHRAAARRARAGRADRTHADAARQHPRHGVPLRERPRLEHADPQRRLPRPHRLHARAS